MPRLDLGTLVDSQSVPDRYWGKRTRTMTARRWVQISALSWLVLAISVVWAAPATAAGERTTHYVDDDGRAGPAQGCDGSRRAFTFIQRAIDVSGPGDIVRVCPGRYRQLVVIPRDKEGLRLISTVPAGAVLVAPAALAQYRAVVQVDAPRVTIRGFQLDVPTTGHCREVQYAILALYHGMDVVINGNRLRTVGGQPYGPCGYGNGISVYRGARVVGNTVDGAKYYAIVSNGRDAVIARNTIHARSVATCSLTGIAVYNHESRVAFNRVIGTAPAIQSLCYGIVQAYEVRGLVVHGNLIRHALDGLALGNGATGAQVTENVVLDSGRRGMLLYHMFDSDIVGNRVRGSRGDGIVVTDMSRNLRVRDNDFRGSPGTDCNDFTTGAGTSGTANTWTDNIGDESRPEGICERAP
jgi:nitrous oxidase accessory protein NosD